MEIRTLEGFARDFEDSTREEREGLLRRARDRHTASGYRQFLWALSVKLRRMADLPDLPQPAEVGGLLVRVITLKPLGAAGS